MNNNSVLDGAAWIASWFGPMLAFWLAVFIVLFAILVSLRAERQSRRLKLALEQVNAALLPVHDAKSDVDAHRALKTAYQDVAVAIRQSGHDGLRLGWTELEESIVDPQAETLCNTVRPDEFFHGLGAPSRQLLWWANFALGVGLLFTFLGIIAALGKASTTMEVADDQTTKAVLELLKVSSAKFLTSLAGVAASLTLRGAEAILRRGIDQRLNRFINALEHGLQYLPPQRLAQMQVDSLKNIETAQTRFATELAVAIGEKFNEQVKPMVAMLGDINGSIRNLNEELGRGLRETVGQGITDAAGQEMQMLAGALTVMTERLGALPERLNEKAGEAETQIRNAAELFSSAAAGMQAAFAGLMQRIEAMSEAVVAQQRAAAEGIGNQVRDNNAAYEAAARQNAEALAQTGSDMREMLQGVASSVAAMGPLLAGQAADAAKVAEDNLRRMGEAQRETTQAIAEAMAKEAAGAAAAAGNEAVAAVAAVTNNLAEQFEAANRRLAERLDAGLARLESFAASMARASDSADASTRQLVEAGVAAERLGGQLSTTGQAVTSELGKAAGALNTAAEPVRQASETIMAAVSESHAALAAQRSAAEAQAEQAKAMASSFAATATAASNAWRDYSERFDNVDEALGKALADLTRDMQQRAAQLAEFASKIDLNTARAVDRLATLVDELAVAQSPPPAGR